MPRSLEQWLNYQAQVHPQTIELGLERLTSVLQRLGWHQPSVPVITVAGTNGKGSVSGYCASILSAAGYHVGTFTSPHLRDYRERIRLHDRLVSEDELLWAFERIERARTEPSAISLTFFEYNALAAILIFEQTRMDAWVLEVGMGGRLDAVNVVDATVAVVVSIGLDHQEFLGDTLEAIAAEKAGIFRKGRSAVLGSRQFPRTLLETAARLCAVPKRLGIEFDYARSDRHWRYQGSRWTFEHLPPPALAGDAQFANAATALAALEELEPRMDISAAAIARGLTSLELPGRFQIIVPGSGQPTWILDVAHNADAARVLKNNLHALSVSGKTLAVYGILADKDASAIAREVRDCFDAWWLVSTEGPRGAAAAELQRRIVGDVRAPLHLTETVAAACAAAATNAQSADRIVVFGSFHIVGPALVWLESQHLLPRVVEPEYTVVPHRR